MQTKRTPSKLLRRSIAVLNGTGIAILVSMMFLITADVLMRGIFHKPIPGSFELIEYMMVFSVFFAIAYTNIEKDHVAIDVLVSHFSIRVQVVIECIISLIGFGVLLIIAWQNVIRGIQLLQNNQVSLVLHIPAYLFFGVAALGCAMFAIVLLDNCYSHIKEAITG